MSVSTQPRGKAPARTNTPAKPMPGTGTTAAQGRPTGPRSEFADDPFARHRSLLRVMGARDGRHVELEIVGDD